MVATTVLTIVPLVAPTVISSLFSLLFRIAMKYAYLFLLAMLAMTSCSSDEIITEEPKTETTPQESVGYRFSINVGEPTTRVTYHDNIGVENSPYNPNSDGTNKLTMSWRNGDELVAIRWSENFDEYVVLKAEVAEGKEEHTITFSAEDVAHFKTPLKNGERFVLVHGDFVLDAGHKTNGVADPVIDFPTSQVTKEGYASHIHHGGVVEGSALTFRNQDGTLENLRKHEYMVADCYVHMGKADASGNVPVTFSGKKDEYQNYVTMHIAHTLLRLTLFLPDEDFPTGENDLISVSLKDADLNPIFHRYFRMHPNTHEESNYYMTSYNDNDDHEENAYIRINLMDEENQKNGVSHSAVNVFGSEDFNPKKPVVVQGTVGDKAGHYFTLYFSLPSRHMGLDGHRASPLKVTIFTSTHAYISTDKSYYLPDDAMKPGMVVPLNVSFVGNIAKIKAITDPELGYSFTPGFVYANKNADGTWTYGVYDNQGQYAGMSRQTLDFGEYFIFGSTDPTQAYHEVGSTKYNAVVPSTFIDVAAEVEVGDVKGLYHMLTKAEAERVMARLKNEIGKNGVFLGYYYYDDGKGNTKHKAPGSQNPEILKEAAGGAKTVEELIAMSATVGIYVGLSHQPKYEKQDDYFFLPNAKQMNNAASTSMAKVQTCTDGSGNPVYYYIPTDYTDLDATGDDTKLTSKFSTKFKFSTWLRTVGVQEKEGYRMQAWTNEKASAMDWGMSNVASFDGKFARPIRAIIY